MSQSYREFYRRHLPHYQPAGTPLFITFRLAGSLPQAVLDEFLHERKALERAFSSIPDVVAQQCKRCDEEWRVFQRWEGALDQANYGPHWLENFRVASAVAEALHYRHNRVYDLLTFCIMPNHVHLLCTPFEQPTGMPYPLAKILQSLKSFTARQANDILDREGPFWNSESYDHAVRNDDELERTVAYIVNNPVKAGLVEDWQAWPWTYLKA